MAPGCLCRDKNIKLCHILHDARLQLYETNDCNVYIYPPSVFYIPCRLALFGRSNEVICDLFGSDVEHDMEIAYKLCQ